MSYALIVNNVIQAETGLPNAARRLDTGQWVLALDTADVALQQACGYHQVVNVQKPADTATHTHDRTVTLVAGTPTVTWTQRAKTPAETAAATAETVDSDLQQKARNALNVNSTFLALSAPTNPQTLAQVQKLTREVNGLIRLLIGADLLVDSPDT